MSEYRRRFEREPQTGGDSARRHPLEVVVGDRGVESALRTFKRLVLRDGILRELKRRKNYEKPGERKRRKMREAARRRRRQLKRNQRRESAPW